MVSPLCLSPAKLSNVSPGTRPRDSLDADKDVKKTNKMDNRLSRSHLYLSFYIFHHMLPDSEMPPSVLLFSTMLLIRNRNKAHQVHVTWKSTMCYLVLHLNCRHDGLYVKTKTSLEHFLIRKTPP